MYNALREFLFRICLSKKKPHCFYSKEDFAIIGSLDASLFDRTLLSAWKDAAINKALNYNIDECNMVSKEIVLGKCIFNITLNEKRFSERRKPQEIMSLNQPFDHSKFNFTKVKSVEVLMTFENVDVRTKDENVIIVNASPFQNGHSLLVPEITACYNQVMRKKPLRTALDMLLISSSRNFTVAFNSMLACASVNHLHWHLWVNEIPLLCSCLELSCLIQLQNGDKVLQMPSHPVQNIVMEVTDLEQLDVVIEKFWIVICCLQKLEIPHSILFVRSGLGVRLIVWPRAVETDHSLKMNCNNVNNIVNVAVAELGGQIFVGDRDYFEHRLDSESLAISFERIRVSDEKWQIIVAAVSRNLIDFINK